MDRFIELGLISNQLQMFCLKSNMDRFIESGYYFAIIEHNSLKSNMDRFIANKPSNDVSTI